jgi:predicted transcriptional regulator
MSGDNKMKLKFLNIVFKESKDFFADIGQALESGKGLNTRAENVLTFDSVKTFNNVMTVNKIQILRVISQLRPESVYQLAMILNREPQHVLKDCRQLEAYKFIKLEETDTGRNSLRPVLAFDYDVIKTDSSIISPYTISERSERLLFGNQAAV